jgi:hypothetical protein
MSLISYVKMSTNKRLLISESHGDSNRRTSYRGKPDTHDTYASRASQCTLHVRFLQAVHIRGNLSLAINSVARILLLLIKKNFGHNPQHAADRSTSLSPSFSPKTIIEAVMKAKHLLTTCYTSLLGP